MSVQQSVKRSAAREAAAQAAAHEQWLQEVQNELRQASSQLKNSVAQAEHMLQVGVYLKCALASSFVNSERHLQGFGSRGWNCP